MARRLAKRRAESRQDMLGIAIGVLTAAKGLAINRKLTARRFIRLAIWMTSGELAENFGQRIRIKDPQRFRKCRMTW